MKKRLFVTICMMTLLLCCLTGQAVAADVVASGKCGADLTWAIDGSGTLTIRGSGAMYDYYKFHSHYGNPPWISYNPTKLVLENGITSISGYAFKDCSSLSGELVLPSSLTSIGEYSFYGCSGLSGTVYFPDSLTEIRRNAFTYCSGFTGDLIIPDNVTTIGYQAFYECTGFDGALYIGDSVTTIHDYAFYACSGFSGELTFGDSLSSIGDYAFYRCSELSGHLILPDHLTSVGDYAFCSCYKLTGDLILPPGLSSIGISSFMATGFNGTLILPYTLTNIPERAFTAAYFDTIYFPTSITNIVHGYTGLVFACALEAPKTLYYGGTQYEWSALKSSHSNSRPQICIIDLSTEHICWESYDAKELFIQDGTDRSIPLDSSKTLLLSADYCTDEDAFTETTDLIWTSSDPSVLKLINTPQTDVSTGYHAISTAEFEAVSEGTVTVTVSANGLSDSCTVTVTDLKELNIVPEDEWKDGTILLENGTSATVRANYRTSGSAADEISSIQWNVSFPPEAEFEEGVEASDIISIETTDYNLSGELDGISYAAVTATIRANDCGGPVMLTVSGPGDCSDAVPVYVPDRKITILESRLAAPPAEPTVQYFHRNAAEEFQIHMLYETMGDIEEELASFTWGVSTESFMVEPEEGVGDACDPALYPAAPTELTWTEQETGKYLIAATFTPAVTGASALKVEAGDFVSDSCIIYAEFDEHVFWANQYWSEDCIAAGNIQTLLLDSKTPSDLFVSELQKSPTFHASAETWQFLSDSFSAVKDVSSLYDVVIRDSDLYLAMLLDILHNYTEDASDTLYRDLQATFKTATNSITDAVKVTFDYDLHKPIDYKKFISDEKNHAFLDQITRDTCADQFAHLDSVSKILKGLDLGLTTIDSVEKAFDKAADDLLMAQLCDSTKAVIHAMYDACVLDEAYGADHSALRNALKECVSMVDRTTEDVLEKQLTDATVIIGKHVAQEASKYLWKCLCASVKDYSVGATIVLTFYETGANIVDEVLGTDGTIEEYYKMLMIQDIRRVAKMSLDDLAHQFKANPTSANAQAYLANIDFLFSALDKDCTTAYSFTDNVSKSMLDNILILLGDTGTADAKTSIANIRRDYTTQWTMSYIFWIDWLPEGPLQNGYEALYYPEFGIPVWRETVACPVDVYVYNSRDQLVAWVEGDEVHCTTGDLTITRHAEQKIITCYSGASYSIRYAGTDSGEMDIIWEEFDGDASVIRTVSYYDVPLTDGSKHTSSDTFTLDGVNADLDTDTAQTYTISISLGTMGLDAKSMFVAKVPAGMTVPISAYTENGGIFSGWTSSQGTGMFADPDSPDTTLRMPASDVHVTAQISRTDDTLPLSALTLFDTDGYLLTQMPSEAVTVRVAVEADTDPSCCLFACYDKNGRMLQLIVPEVSHREDGALLLSVALDNTSGRTQTLKFFRLNLHDDLNPTAPCLYISAR